MTLLQAMALAAAGMFGAAFIWWSLAALERALSRYELGRPAFFVIVAFVMLTIFIYTSVGTQ